jgi:ABC-2 type transport system permease protein
MSTVATVTRPRPKGGILAAAKLAFATVGTRGRLIASVGGVLFFVALAAILKASGTLDQEDAAIEIVVASYFFLLLPLMTVSNASLAFGSAVQDDTLVYLWLRPIAKWKLAVSHVAATVASLVPMIVVLSLATLLFESSVRFAGGVALASLLIALAYSGPVVALGVRFKRASMMALTYVILVESILGAVGPIARLSIRNYGVVLFGHLASDVSGVALPGVPNWSALTCAAVLLGVFVAGTALTTFFLKRADVA